MRSFALHFLPVLLLCAGCNALQLAHSTVRQSSKLTDMQYQQVLENLAMLSAEPGALPWFNKATGGKTTIQQTGQASGGLNWDYLAGAKAATFLNHLDKKNLGIQATQQNVGEWDTTPEINPDKLRLMRCLYLRALGFDCTDPECERTLSLFFKDYPQHLAAVRPGWFQVGKLTDAPPLACYKGCYKTTCAWVLPEGVEGLTQLTCAILDVTTASTIAVPPTEAHLAATAIKAQEDRVKYMTDLYKSLLGDESSAGAAVIERFHKQLLAALAKLSTLYSPLPDAKKQQMYHDAIKLIYGNPGEDPKLSAYATKRITNAAELTALRKMLTEEREDLLSRPYSDTPAIPSSPPLFRPREPSPYVPSGPNVLPIP
jgi:hypothetical protein